MINGIPVLAGLATIPERSASLRETILSLAPQVDHLLVYGNGEVSIPFADRGPENVDYYLPFPFHGPKSDIGDIGKFVSIDRYWDHGKEFYFLTCDDDLIYPDDYVETLVNGIERQGRHAACGFHGKKYYGPVKSYYRSLGGAMKRGEATNFRCLDDCWSESRVTIIGTGCMGFHSSILSRGIVPFDRAVFPTPNMADIHFSAWCNDAGIYRVVLPHEEGWIKHSDHVDIRKDTIAARSRDDDQLQTMYFNLIDWKL